VPAGKFQSGFLIGSLSTASGLFQTYQASCVFVISYTDSVIKELQRRKGHKKLYLFQE